MQWRALSRQRLQNELDGQIYTYLQYLRYFKDFSMYLFTFVTTNVIKKPKAQRHPAWMENLIYVYLCLVMYIYVL